MAGLPTNQPACSENLTSCMDDLTRIILAPCSVGQSPDGASPVLRQDTVESKLEPVRLNHSGGVPVECAANMPVTPETRNACQPVAASEPFLDFEMEGINMFYSDGADHSGGLFGEEALREPDFDGAMPSLLGSEAQPAAWGPKEPQFDPVSVSDARPSPLFFSKPSDPLFAPTEATTTVDAWSWVPAGIVSAPRGVAAFLSDGGDGGVSSSAEALFPVVSMSEEITSPNPPPKEEGLTWVPRVLKDDAELLQSGSNSSILGRISDAEVTHVDRPEGRAEDAGRSDSQWKSPRLVEDAGVEDDRVNASGSPMSSRSIGSGRGCRRRVHPVSKFIGEEVCWTPDENDGSDSNGSRERLRRAPRTGKSSGRLGRARGRAFGRQGSWEGLASSASDSINKRRKQHNPWYQTALWSALAR